MTATSPPTKGSGFHLTGLLCQGWIVGVGIGEWAERGNLSIQGLVNHVILHELAQLFRWSDDDIAAIDPWWE